MQGAGALALPPAAAQPTGITMMDILQLAEPANTHA